MPVVARKEYLGVARDTVDKFNGMQLVYVCWDHHLLFSAPFLLFVSPQMTFKDLRDQILMTLVQADPSSDDIDWDKVVWVKSNKTWQPNLDASLKENAIMHKEQIRFSTDKPVSEAGI